MALGATAATEAIYDAFLSTDRRRTFFHGHSYTANPLACAAALASLELLDDTSAGARASIERAHATGLARLSSQMPLAEKRKYADYVIDTSGAKEDTLEQTEEVYNSLRSLKL